MDNFFFTFVKCTGFLKYEKVVLSAIYNEKTGGYDYERSSMFNLGYEYDNLAKFKSALKGYIKRQGTPVSVSAELTDQSERGRERYTEDFLQYFMD